MAEMLTSSASAIYSPIGKRVVVRPVPKETESKGGIILNQTLKKQRGEGTVLAVGKEVKKLAVGDHVLFSPLYYDEIDETHFVIEEDDIWAVVN